MSDLVILGLPPSAYVRTARMICACKGVPHSLQPVDFRSAEYKASHHPFSRMPALQHGDVKLYECLAIGVYVDEFFDGPALQPKDPLKKAVMMQWISAVNDYIYCVVVGQCVAERFIKPMRGLEPDTERLAAAMPVMADQLDVVGATLKTSPYLAGDAATLADLFLAPVLHYLAATPEGAELLPPQTAIVDWMARIKDLPDFDQINALGP